MRNSGRSDEQMQELERVMQELKEKAGCSKKGETKMTYGEILIVCGVALAALGVLTLIIGAAAISSAKKN